MSRLAELFAKREGHGTPGAIPTVRNNPLDLRHSPHSTHPPDDPNGIGYIDTLEHGWEDGERQLQLFASRGLTLKEAVYEFAPAPENDPSAYLAFLCKGLGCKPDILMSDALKIGEPKVIPKVSASKVGAVAAGTYAGTLAVGALNHFMAITMPDRYSEAVIGLCIMVAVHFLKDSPSG